MFADFISSRHRTNFAPTYLSIAIGITLSSLTVSAQAADSSQQSNELANASLIEQQTQLFFDCTQVQTDAARLACFDKVAQQGKTPSYTTTKQPLDLAKTIQQTFNGKPQVVLAEDIIPINADSVEDADQVLVIDQSAVQQNLKNGISTRTEAQILEAVGVTQSEIEKYTPMSLAYDLDKNSQYGTWSARPHRPMYLLPFFYSDSPNRNPSTPNQEQVDFTSNDIRDVELKLQVSIKTKVVEDLFNTNADMWFGYTQQSHWQVYNEDNSRPFRATDYEPEIFITQPVTANLPFGGRLRMLGVGAVHHSNGQSDPLSRSWNRLYVMGGAEWGKFAIIPRVWTRIQAESSSDQDDNPDIEDFLGYGDVTFLYDLPKRQSISGTLRYNPKTDKGAAQIDYSYPLSDNVNGYVQLFHGYGESLIDYNHRNTAIGFGVVLNDWKGL